LAVGVTETVPLMVAVPLLEAVNTGILAVPLAARPIPVLVFVHAKVVPATVPVGVVKVDDAPLQYV